MAKKYDANVLIALGDTMSGIAKFVDVVGAIAGLAVAYLTHRLTQSDPELNGLAWLIVVGLPGGAVYFCANLLSKTIEVLSHTVLWMVKLEENTNHN